MSGIWVLDDIQSLGSINPLRMTGRFIFRKKDGGQARPTGDHLFRSSRGDPHERVSPDTAVGPLDQDAASDGVAHGREDVLCVAPSLVGEAVGRQRPDIEHRQQANAKELGRNTSPLIGGIAGQEGRRLGDVLGDVRPRLRSDSSSAGSA